MGVKQELDKFYTKKDVVEQLLKEIDLKNFDLIIEPSAGNGGFSDFLYSFNMVALDIEPEKDYIIKQDWFTFDTSNHYRKVLVIGNPPFGLRNILSKRFIEHALKIENINTIAFVLPDVFNKHTNQKIFPKEWKLKQVIKLPRDSFTLDGEEYHVPCSFYIWTKDDVEKDLRFNPDEFITQDFEYILTKDKENADFFVMGASPRVVKEIADVHINNRGYYIKSLIGKEILMDRFRNINWNEHGNSSVNGGASWFSKPELIKAYEEQKNKI